MADSSAAASPPASGPQIEWPSRVRETVDLLGGPRVVRRNVGSDQAAHDLVAGGIPGAALMTFVDALPNLSVDDVLAALGVSARSFARRKAAPRALLPLHEGERLWRFAEILAQAMRVFGSRQEAEAWLARPAAVLDHRRPIELLKTFPGARLVVQYLTRIEYGVYT